MLLSGMLHAENYLVSNFENTISDVFVAWNGSCSQIVNPFSNSDNSSATVLKIISDDYAPVGFPISLPTGKTLKNYVGIRFQVAILEEISGSSINWIGFNVGVSENKNSMQLIDPDSGNGAAWATGQIGKWYTVDLMFNNEKLSSELNKFTSSAINVMIKLGRKQFIYAVDNIQLIEKTEYIGSISSNYMGVNLSGGEFGGIYPGIDGTNYGYPTYKDLDYFKSKGLMLIRLPFRWERIQYEMNGDLVSSEIAKIKTFVKAAEDRGIPVILDMHNFGRYSFDGGTTYTLIGESSKITKENLGNVWAKIAAEFKAFTNIWAYDIMNEPYSMSASCPWFDIAQQTINDIRNVDTKTPIVVSGDWFSSSLYWVQYSDNLRNLTDPNDNLIFQAHCYFDKDQSGNYAGSYDTEAASLQTGVNRMQPFVEWLKKYNKRGLLGEYGVPDNDDRWLVTLENALKYLTENGVPGTYWSAGPRWGSYKLAVQPGNNYTTDRPQMLILEKYPQTNLQTSENTQIQKGDNFICHGLKNGISIKTDQKVSITIYNLAGVPIFSRNLPAESDIKIPVKPGIYFLMNKKVMVF